MFYICFITFNWLDKGFLGILRDSWAFLQNIWRIPDVLEVFKKICFITFNWLDKGFLGILDEFDEIFEVFLMH